MADYMESWSRPWLSIMHRMAHCTKRISPCWQQTIEISGSDRHMWSSAESAEKMSKREMKWPPRRPWTWLNQQWKSMSWKELAGKINEGIMHWPMNFVPFWILVWCSNLNIQVSLLQIILAFPFIFKFSVTSMLLYIRHCAQFKASRGDAIIVPLTPQGRAARD